PGWVCHSDQGCPAREGYKRSCDTDIRRCRCASSNMAASLAVVLLAVGVSLVQSRSLWL
ncbi:hypothetical protein PoB_005056700, partial [Plakobranchus ocellatus]